MSPLHSAETGFSSFTSKSLFSGKKIEAKSYFLLARQGSDFESISDLVFEDTLTENNTLILKNPNQEIADSAGWQAILSDNSWGRIYDEQNQTYVEPFENQVQTPKEKNNRWPAG